jgi:hypothetical protein
MQEHINQVERPQTNREMGVEQRMETGGSLAQGSVSGQDVKRFREAFNKGDERLALHRLAKAFGDGGADSLKEPGELAVEKLALISYADDGSQAASLVSSMDGASRKKTPGELIAEDDGGVDALRETGMPLVEVNVAQANPIFFPMNVREVRQTFQKIVDVLLVSEALSNGDQEVTMRLKDCLLAGADVSLFRDGGTMRINFSSLTPHMEVLVKANLSLLCEAVSSKTDIKDVKVSTSLREDADTNHGRSRGYMGFLSDGEDEEETDSTGRRVRRHGRVTRKSTAGHA